MKVVIYCPDRHMVYDGSTPERTGVGGGVTARIRAAAALARTGLEVTVICNTLAEAVQDGVLYQPLEPSRPIDADILIAHTSGGGLDLSPLTTIPIKTRLRVLFVSGVDEPRGARDFGAGYYYTPSHFLRGIAEQDWGVDAARTFVTNHGVMLRPGTAPERDPFKLIYSSHPSKGLDAAMGVLRILRARDPRFHLEVYGGDRLWGGSEAPPPAEFGMRYHGLVDQNVLASAYQGAGFAMHLQTRLEPFGLTLIESMSGGAIPIVSPCGAFAELVRDGVDGIVIAGDPADESVRRRAADGILAAFPSLSVLRVRAQTSVITWDQMAAAWNGHWRWALDGLGEFDTRPCGACAGRLLRLADGDHCVDCGVCERR